MAKVARLSDELINKIAAGEVVERPASVVKELAENALDAGAREIRVGLAGGGLGLVSVSDDGSGMSREDAVLALERHATSKLRDLEGLFALHTMGFRGEALPSIASVSRFTLLTSVPDATVGTRVYVEGGAPLELEDAAPAGGTVIRVEDLFFNTPARRKFLKREETELKHAEEAVIRLALAHPEVGFRVEHEGRTLFNAPPQPLPERIAAALGAEAHPHLIEVDERRLGVRLTGFIASGAYTLSNARGLYTFVNRRYIRDRGVNYAIQRAFQDVLPPGRQPVAVLFLEVDPAQVDVNVHPQKLEVRFADPRGVQDVLVAGVGRALRSAVPATPGAVAAPGDEARYQLAVDRFLARAQEQQGSPLTQPAGMPAGSPFAPSSVGQAPAFGQARPGINEAPPPGYFSALKFVGPLARRFWLCEAPGGSLVVVDPHAARERVELTRLRAGFGGARREQGTLFGATLELPPVLQRQVVERAAGFRLIGVDVEAFGGSAVRVVGLPAGLEAPASIELVAELTELLPSGAPEHVDAYAAPLRVLACAFATAADRALGAEDRRSLCEALDAAEFHAPARHSVIVALDLPLLELERRAGRFSERGLEE